MTRQVLRSRARKQASTMLAELETMWPGASDQLTVNAVDAIGSWDQVAVRLVPDSETDAGCSVAGAYIAEMTPPVVAIAVAASAGRRAFTALHELGHHLQQTRKALYEPLLVDADDGGTALEDAACDAFAAGLLLPDALVDRHVGARGPEADDLVALWEASSASRAATCVRASERLPSTGHVLLLDEAGRVVFAAPHGLPPVRRGSDQSDIPVISDALNRASARASGRTRLATETALPATNCTPRSPRWVASSSPWFSRTAHPGEGSHPPRVLLAPEAGPVSASGPIASTNSPHSPRPAIPVARRLVLNVSGATANPGSPSASARCVT